MESGAIAVRLANYLAIGSVRPREENRAWSGPDKTGGTGDNFGFGKTGLALRGDSERRGSQTP